MTRKIAPEPLSCPADVDPEVWAAWVELRKLKRAPITPLVARLARSEAAKAGLTFEDFLGQWLLLGWQGLRADWLVRQGTATTKPRSDWLARFTPNVAAAMKQADAMHEAHRRGEDGFDIDGTNLVRPLQ